MEGGGFFYVVASKIFYVLCPQDQLKYNSVIQLAITPFMIITQEDHCGMEAERGGTAMDT